MPSPQLRALGSFRRWAESAPVWSGRVAAPLWLSLGQAIHGQGGRLMGLWGEDRRAAEGCFLVHGAFLFEQGLLLAEQEVNAARPETPSLAAIFPAANRMERTLYDLLGIRAQGLADQRPWLRHQAWPEDQFPLRADFTGSDLGSAGDDRYAFVPVSGAEVHEIPVGPVHAGTIEPGHFRFQVLGEEVLRLEAHLGYTHKGTERLFQGRDIAGGARLAGRVSGDSTVAYGWVYARAVEQILALTPPSRAQWLRALCLERERLANHLGDLGALGNDAGLAFALTQFSRLKEDFLRDQERYFGHRYLMDRIAPGGVAFDLDARQCAALRGAGRALGVAVARLQEILAEHGGLRDRVVTLGRIPPPLAADLGMMGVAGRASGQAWDLRVQFPQPPYDALDVRMALESDGDVAARMAVRFAEITESLRLQDQILDALPAGETLLPVAGLPADGVGAAWVEGWRGEILLWLRMEKGRITRCHPQDPSWTLWPAVEQAVLRDIVADFPLINKSFNLNYSGHDL